MIHSGKNVKEISETFDIAENVVYRWKTDQNMKTKTKTNDDQSNFTLKLIAENEFLKKDNNRLQTGVHQKVWGNHAASLISESSFKDFTALNLGYFFLNSPSQSLFNTLVLA